MDFLGYALHYPNTVLYSKLQTKLSYLVGEGRQSLFVYCTLDMIVTMSLLCLLCLYVQAKSCTPFATWVAQFSK